MLSKSLLEKPVKDKAQCCTSCDGKGRNSDVGEGTSQSGDKHQEFCSFHFGYFLPIFLVRSIDNFAVVMLNFNVTPLPTESTLCSVKV